MKFMTLLEGMVGEQSVDVSSCNSTKEDVQR